MSDDEEEEGRGRKREEEKFSSSKNRSTRFALEFAVSVWRRRRVVMIVSCVFEHKYCRSLPPPLPPPHSGLKPRRTLPRPLHALVRHVVVQNGAAASSQGFPPWPLLEARKVWVSRHADLYYISHVIFHMPIVSTSGRRARRCRHRVLGRPRVERLGLDALAWLPEAHYLRGDATLSR